jgi:hypothetical protein
MKTSFTMYAALLALIGAPQVLWAHDHESTPPNLRRNVCDRLLNPSDDDLNDCFEDHGRSEWRIQQDQVRVAIDQARRDQDNTDARERSLLELEVFSRADGTLRAYGDQFIAVGIILNRRGEEIRPVLDFDQVCREHGFVQAVEYTIGGQFQEIDAREAGNEHNRGVVFSQMGTRKPYSRAFLSGIDWVRPLESITCARTRDGSTEALRHLPEIEMNIDESIGRPVRTTSPVVNDAARDPVPPQYGDFTSGVRRNNQPAGGATDRY